MRFYFIRHGQSQNNQLYARTGSWEGRSADPELTPLGRQQAERLAEFLRQPGLPEPDPPRRYDAQNVGGFGISHLYCSLFIRAVATGAVVARALDLPLVAWIDTHEVGGVHQRDLETGEHRGLPGHNRAFFEAHYPELVLPESLGDEGWWNRPFEEGEQRLLRARRFWEGLLDRHGGSGDRVAVISHGGFYNYVMRALLKAPQGHWFALSNAAITRVDCVDGEVGVQYMNRVDFLPRELIT
jgi:2,3-bisphosphoglycerate-dependent phosphoglycerate mutase